MFAFTLTPRNKAFQGTDKNYALLAECLIAIYWFNKIIKEKMSEKWSGYVMQNEIDFNVNAIKST